MNGTPREKKKEEEITKTFHTIFFPFFPEFNYGNFFSFTVPTRIKMKIKREMDIFFVGSLHNAIVIIIWQIAVFGDLFPSPPHVISKQKQP